MSIRLRKPIVAATLVVAGYSTSALAHQLNVFAWVDDGTVIVEAKFSNGRFAGMGDVRVFDNIDNLILETSLEPDGLARFQIPDNVSGMKIEVTAADGHSNSWILTEYDISGGVEN